MPSLTPDVRRQQLARGRGLALAVAQRHQRLQDVGLRVARGRGRQRQVGAELALQLEQQPLGGLLADAGHLHQPAALLQRDGLRQFGDAQARQDRQRGARADAGDLHELAEGGALVVR